MEKKKGGAFCVFQYRRTTEKELCRLWNRSILEHPFDRRYRAWKRVFLQLNRNGTGATFAVLRNGKPVGEGTLLFSPQADAVRGRKWLADGVRPEIGKKYGKSAAQVALRWNVQRGVVVIPKSTHKARMEQNFDIWDFELSDGDMAKIAELDAGKSRIVDHDDPSFIKMLHGLKVHD